jgi:ankyrin repeat protein
MDTSYVAWQRLCTSNNHVFLRVTQWLGFPDIVQLFLLKGADPSGTCVRGLTPMHLAAHARYMRGRTFEDAMQEYVEVIRALNEAGAHVDQADAAHGLTPLHIAARYNRPSIVLELLDWEAEPKAQDNDGADALAHAYDLERMHSSLREQTVALLQSSSCTQHQLEARAPASDRDIKVQWLFGISGYAWSYGAELAMHLFGMCIAARAELGWKAPCVSARVRLAEDTPVSSFKNLPS